MGLCKCRNVTNLYCFVHRTHVCEKCVTESHKNCVVNSYLQWVQDSDYDWPPLCPLCRGELGEKDVVRLQCMHTFHPGCIDNYGANLPGTTAFAGYACPHPGCGKPLLPPGTSITKLAEDIRHKVGGSPWAQKLTQMAASHKPLDSASGSGIMSQGSSRIGPSRTPATPMRSADHTSVSISQSPSTPGQGGEHTGHVGGVGGSRKPLLKGDVLPTHYDDDDDKYRKGKNTKAVLQSKMAGVSWARIIVGIVVLSAIIGVLIVAFGSPGVASRKPPASQLPS